MTLRPFALLLLLAGCASGERHAELARTSPAFAPGKFFSGRTEGVGRLKIVFSEAHGFVVHGRGQVEPDGTLLLDQTVAQQGKDPTQREWRLRPAPGGGFTGTLSDASGPVWGETRGNMLHIRFPMKGGMNAEQWLYLQPDGRTVLNRMSVTKLGLRVATVEETIRNQSD